MSLDLKALARALDPELGQMGLSELVRQRCPCLYAALPVFVAAPQLQRMAQVMQAVESVVALSADREQVLDAAAGIARLGFAGPLGVFFGYDFHLSDGHLGLIEINTNAGGAMLNAGLARAQRAGCSAVAAMVPTLDSVSAFEQGTVEMFRHEWQLSNVSGRDGQVHPLASIAIVDEAPEDQYLYPEFLLFQHLFEKHGIRAVIAGPGALEWRDGLPWHGDLAIDLAARMPPELKLQEGGKHPLKAISRGPLPDKLLAEPEAPAHFTPIRGSKLWHLALLEWWLQVHVDRADHAA